MDRATSMDSTNSDEISSTTTSLPTTRSIRVLASRDRRQHQANCYETLTNSEALVELQPDGTHDSHSVASRRSRRTRPTLMAKATASGHRRAPASSHVQHLTDTAKLGPKMLRRSERTSNREKWRQVNVNRAFQDLRRLVPAHPPERRLSKHEILRMAIKYIRLLESILAPSAR